MAYLSPPLPPVPPSARTSNYQFTRNDDGVPIQFNAEAGPITAQLPNASTVPGCTFIVVKIDSSINAVTINTTINGMPTTILTDQYASLIVMAANGAYNIVALTIP